ncbi:MAG TPA: hypothetical protein VHT24_02765 [Pseudacidobacterium sp.]|jgi:hypothetical protein|nr:hypothetical protein [Pseudacidobacterium sp.]
MAQPALTTVTVDGDKFNAVSTHVGITTQHDHMGLPQMGTLMCSIQFVVNMHDDKNMPFSTLSKLFNLANIVTRDKIKDIKIEYWKDESQQDALCTYSFKGWLSHFSTNSGEGANHLLTITVQPALDSKNYVDLKMGN